MLTKCTVLAVERREHKGKPIADVVLLFTHPTEAFTVTLWNNSIAEGHEKPYEKLIGQVAFVPVQFDVFNGKLQCRLHTGTLPQAAHAPTVKAAG